MKRILIVLLVSVMASSAFAVIDPDPDMIGVYFDQVADQNVLDIGPSIPFNAYIIITRPSYPQVWGLEVGYGIVSDVPGGFFRLSAILPAGAVDLGNSVLPEFGDYIVGLASPLPSTEAVVFVSWQFLLLVPQTLEFYLGPASVESIPDGLPAYEAGGIIKSLGLSTGSPDTPVAAANGSVPVGVEDVSFGGVKALFR